MRSFLSPRFSARVSAPVWCGAVASVLIWSAGIAGAEAVSWVRYSGSDNGQCAALRTPALTCGSYGSFTLGAPSAPPPSARDNGTCGAGASGTEEPRVLAPELIMAPASPWVPCADGTCFDQPPESDWVAVVDWDDLHGYTVAETILQAADRSVSVRLFDLESWDPGVGGDELRSASDLQVLAQLCRVVEAAEAGPAPLVLNMSFGRLWQGGVDPCTGGDSLACEVHHVLGHLRALGVAAVAAAGNHSGLLYPAADTHVIGAGGLDLIRFARSGGAFVSALTSPCAEMLLPAQGLVLEEPGGGGLWAQPPGSSYASALAAGWLAAYRRREPEAANFLAGASFGWNGREIWPVRQGDGYALAYRDQLLPGSVQAGPARLLRTALGLRPEIYDSLGPSGTGEGDTRCVLVPHTLNPARIKSFPELVSVTNRPSPDSEPCVPCRLRRPALLRAAQRASCAEQPDLILELGRSAGTAPDARLVGMVMTIGLDLYFFQVGMFDPAAFPDLEGGLIKEYQINLGSSELAARLHDEPVTLRYIMQRPGESETYWDATPLTIHLREVHAIFSDGFEAGTTAWAGGAPP